MFIRSFSLEYLISFNSITIISFLLCLYKSHIIVKTDTDVINFVRYAMWKFSCWHTHFKLMLSIKKYSFLSFFRFLIYSSLSQNIWLQSKIRLMPSGTLWIWRRLFRKSVSIMTLKCPSWFFCWLSLAEICCLPLPTFFFFFSSVASENFLWLSFTTWPTREKRVLLFVLEIQILDTETANQQLPTRAGTVGHFVWAKISRLLFNITPATLKQSTRLGRKGHWWTTC